MLLFIFDRGIEVQFKWDYITTLLVIQIGPDSVGKSGLLLRPIDSVFFTIFFLGHLPFALYLTAVRYSHGSALESIPV
jgi:hypothetical protein